MPEVAGIEKYSEFALRTPIICPKILDKVIILPGVSIGEGAIVGAGAVVTHNIPAYSVAVGNPARVVKTLK